MSLNCKLKCSSTYEPKLQVTTLFKLACEFTCVTDEQKRRVKQDILAKFKDAFVKSHKGIDRDFYICWPSTYSPKLERAYRDVNLSKPNGMRSLLASLSPRLKDKMHHVLSCRK
ncbi:hypothetical protein H5410_015975 [Solanum commersonii]|uniref:Uncharacterized protein n=1 Tax=Solanum commersonii TaxID=4109 RepID=A0A9J5ZW74_SOLCO|nr:hypothetical protein H5410_015975 [Solanum commersonii]